MIFRCQQEAYSLLKRFAAQQRRSVCIEGPQGCGKTFLAREYAKLLGITDFKTVSPVVDDIRECIEAVLSLRTPVVLQVENLDNGGAAAASALLKILEEPRNNLYIVVTCENLYRIPDTIVSRSTCVTVGGPTEVDIVDYSEMLDFQKYHQLKDNSIWKAVRNFNQVKLVFDMNLAQLEYFAKLPDVFKFSDAVSNLMWKLQHYDDNTTTPIQLVLQYLVCVSPTVYIRKLILEALDELDRHRLADHVVLANLLMAAKYTE